MVDRLIDYLVIVGPGRGVVFEKSTEGKTSFGSSLGPLNSWHRVTSPVPTILRRFPQDDHDDVQLAFDMAYFCQPNGSGTEVNSPQTHTFMLTDTETNTRTYGVCFSIPHLFDPLEKAQTLCNLQEEDSICIQEWGVLSICVLSRHPFFTFLEKCLVTLAHFVERFCGGNLSWNGLIRSQYSHPNLHDNSDEFAAVTEVERWIERLLALKSPAPGVSALEIELEVDPAVVICYPPTNRLPLFDMAVHRIFKRVGVCNLIDIYKLVLSEQKVVLHSDDHSFVSECVLAVVALLYPLQYLFPVIPLLPTSMPTAENLLMVPTPFFIGVHSSFLSKLQDIDLAEVWLINLDTGEFVSPSQPDQPSPLEFPYCILQLQADVRRALDEITNVTKPPDSTHPSIDSSNWGASSLEERCQGDDVDVMIRISFVDFLFSPEILGTIDQHLCIFRLFPRPVVALRSTSFLNTYQKLSPVTDTQFIRDLMQSQGIEYFFEWSLNPTNSAFEEIRRGVHSVGRLSDKQLYYVHKSALRHHQVCLYETSDDSILYQEMLSYKASQASYSLAQAGEINSDDSDWECLEYYDGGSEITVSTPSYFSDDQGRSPDMLTRKLGVSNQHVGDTTIPVSGVGGQLTVGFQPRHPFQFPPHDVAGYYFSNRQEKSSHLEIPNALDSSSSTESITYDDEQSRLVGSLNAKGLSVSCEALPIADIVERDNTKFVTPGGIEDTTPKRFSFPRPRSSTPPSPLQSPTEKYLSNDTIIITRRRTAGSQELRQPFASPVPTAEVVEFTTPLSSLRRTSSLRVRGEMVGSATPPVSRTVPLSAVTHSQTLEAQLQDVVMKILDGQGLPWPKPPSLKRLATYEKTRIMVLRLLENRLGLRTSNELAMSTDHQLQPVGVGKSVYRGLVDLLKYFLQCIEEDLGKTPEASIFSAFLILRIAFSTFLLPKKQAQNTKVTKSQMEQFQSTTTLPFPASLTSVDSFTLASGDTISISSSPVPGTHSPDDPSIRKIQRPAHSETSLLKFKRHGYTHKDERSSKVSPAPSPTPNLNSADRDAHVTLAKEDDSEDPIPAGNPITAMTQLEDLEGIDTDTKLMDATPQRKPQLDSTSLADEKEQFYTPPPYLDTDTPRVLPRQLSPMFGGPPIASTCPSPKSRQKLQDEDSRTYLYKDLMKALGSSRTFMVNRHFWNVLFMSTIDEDRNYLGWNEKTAELYERYNFLTEAHRQAFASEENTLLSLVLHDLLVYMLAVGLTPSETTDLIHRLMARTRLAIAEERLLQQTLKHVEQSTSGEVDLSGLSLMALYSEVHPTIAYIVHYGINMIAPVYKLQITTEALILRRFPDEKISSRLWNDSVTGLSYNDRRATVTIKYRDDNGEYNHHFHSKEFTKVFESLQLLIFGSRDL